MRLGDLDALKKAICIDEPISIDETWEQLYDAVVKTIDNAPTVNPTYPLPEDVFLKITDAEWEHSDNVCITTPSGKKIELEKKRQPGKWIYHKERENEGECPYECPHCGRTYDYAMNFCGYCGLKMNMEEKE